MKGFIVPFSGLTTPVEMKLKLIPILTRMHHDISTATQVEGLIITCFSSIVQFLTLPLHPPSSSLSSSFLILLNLSSHRPFSPSLLTIPPHRPSSSPPLLTTPPHRPSSSPPLLTVPPHHLSSPSLPTFSPHSSPSLPSLPTLSPSPYLFTLSPGEGPLCQAASFLSLSLLCHRHPSHTH